MYKKIAILGSGLGGYAMTADLSMAGYEVNLFELPEFSDNLNPVIEKGGIDIVAKTPSGQEFQLPGGGKTGFTKITGKITSNIQDAVEGVDLVMLVVPAYGRERFMREFAPYLQDGQTVVIWPGYFGAIQFVKILNDMNINKEITICETESLIYACKKVNRKLTPAFSLVTGKKEKLLLGVLPSKKTMEVLKELNKIFPQLTPAKNVLETTLTNINPPFRPLSLLLNLYRVERKFYPYFESIGGPLCSNYDITPGMANVMEAVDNERISIGKKFGIAIKSLKDTLQTFYGGNEKNLYETILNVYAYQTNEGPTTLDHQYITEDLPFGLIPNALLGEQLNVPTPLTRAVVEIGCTATGKDFWNTGLTIDKLGLTGMNVKEINEYINNIGIGK